MKLVRQFSTAGPCIMLGELVRETPQFYLYQEGAGCKAFWPADRGHVFKIKKRGDLVHIEPCRSCRDHPETQYPNGYED